MVKKYGKDTKEILDCIKDTPTIIATHITKLNEELKEYMDIIEERYKKVMGSLINLCNKNNNTDVVNIVEGLCSFTEFSDIPELKSIGVMANVGKIGASTCNLLKHKLEECLNDNLSNESQELLLKYKDISTGQKGTLLYVLDSVRLELIKNQSLEKRKKLKLYSDMGIIPLIDAMFYRPQIIWEPKYRFHLSTKDLRSVEIAWLTTYYIMCEKIDDNVVYTRRNNALISWKFFFECLKIRIPNVEIKELNVFKGILIKYYHWDIDKNKEINLWSLLKKS